MLQWLTNLALVLLVHCKGYAERKGVEELSSQEEVDLDYYYIVLIHQRFTRSIALQSILKKKKNIWTWGLVLRVEPLVTRWRPHAGFFQTRKNKHVQCSQAPSCFLRCTQSIFQTQQRRFRKVVKWNHKNNKRMVKNKRFACVWICKWSRWPPKTACLFRFILNLFEKDEKRWIKAKFNLLSSWGSRFTYALTETLVCPLMMMTMMMMRKSRCAQPRKPIVYRLLIGLCISFFSLHLPPLDSSYFLLFVVVFVAQE